MRNRMRTNITIAVFQGQYNRQESQEKAFQKPALASLGTLRTIARRCHRRRHCWCRCCRLLDSVCVLSKFVCSVFPNSCSHSQKEGCLVLFAGGGESSEEGSFPTKTKNHKTTIPIKSQKQSIKVQTNKQTITMGLFMSTLWMRLSGGECMNVQASKQATFQKYSTFVFVFVWLIIIRSRTKSSAHAGVGWCGQDNYFVQVEARRSGCFDSHYWWVSSAVQLSIANLCFLILLIPLIDDCLLFAICAIN
jgi:hypothetical protein